MKYALFLNGVHKEVLEEIRTSQALQPDLICYLQPYSSEVIDKLKEEPPSPSNRITLFISLTSSLAFVSYKAEIIGWENKQDIEPDRLMYLNDQISAHQPNEREIYFSGGYDRPAINLLSIKNLVQFKTPFPLSSFMRIPDNSPLQPRKRAGGWSYIQAMPTWLGTMSETAIAENLQEEFDLTVRRSMAQDHTIREKRLAEASRYGEPILMLSREYKRNPDVVAAVMLRAGGNCEHCGAAAPFNRASDGLPYLELHHPVPLSKGGEDTTRNAIAVCPNCHRKLHFG